MNKEQDIKSIGKLVFLHFFPGVIGTILYVIILRQGILSEYPKVIHLSLASFLSMAPLQIGYLCYKSYTEVNSFNFFKILGLKSKLPLKEYLIYTPVLLIAAGLAMLALNPLTEIMLSWFPDWFTSLYIEDMAQYSKPILLITTLVSFFYLTIIAPIIEELYFRGYLLARMKWMGNYGVLLNIVLFSIYHFWSPWLIVSRSIAFLPWLYVVNKKNSLGLAIAVHCLANFTDVIAMLFLLLQV
ncbi:hypothetical protein EDC19_0592 [Natranaerovirga hydrolytica]|uniref:CAAX prenyl protease 2/Lysostaphin resistance protein A-like domain-containing protein n=1 Tax=Natranaerovirga hydrolytica TaxID=680378 RepID=A0A4R1N2E4_9FIRM|nr:CPBP family intramembrane glutamic endopeptidase [Natranaerovirga hydrolytica]TCK98174.1 hypothetical protein EDC19_0592 [Natranaerovirga hydrolytica]